MKILQILLPPPAKAAPLLMKEGIECRNFCSIKFDNQSFIRISGRYFFVILLTVILYSSAKTYAQTDWVKWGKADYNYQVNSPVSQRDFSFDLSNPGRFILKSFANVYWLFISDVDGDNCSFNPTCSAFFIQSVEKTNIVQGTLMFFDRFTRDMDIFGKMNHYPRVPDGHLFDPPNLYILDSDSINYIPPSVVVKNE
jgi:hypothetical protein